MEAWIEPEPYLPSRVRRFTRRAVDLRCEIFVDGSDAPRAERITELTPYGAFVATEAPLPIGEHLVVSFCPPGKDAEVVLFAEVARVARDGRPGMGLAFGVPTEEEHAVLLRSLFNVPPPFRPRPRA